MFDGSHRTNKREINLTGASASSRSSSRRSNVETARRERKARAAAKAKIDSAVRVQRSWRGMRCRRALASSLDVGYGECIAAAMTKTTMTTTTTTTDGLGDDDDAMLDDDDDDDDDDDNGRGRRRRSRQRRLLSDAASLLAFRMTPPLLPHFATSSRHGRDDDRDDALPAPALGGGRDRWGPEDAFAEARLRRDLSSLGDVAAAATMATMPPVPRGEEDDDDRTTMISDVAARRLISITLVLLRQSMDNGNDDSTTTTGGGDAATEEDGRRRRRRRRQRDEEDEGLVRLLDRLLGFLHWSGGGGTSWGTIGGAAAASTTSPPPPPSIAGWMIDLFLCFRDVVSSARPGDADDGGARGRTMSSTLLKWCCRIVAHLATLDDGDGGGRSTQFLTTAVAATTTTTTTTSPELRRPLALHQQGLALLASILCARTNCLGGGGGDSSWTHEHLIPCLSDLERRLAGPTTVGRGGMAVIDDDVHPSSLLIHHLSTAMDSLSATTASSYRGRAKDEGGRRRVPGFMPSSSLAQHSTASEEPFLDAVRDTLSAREVVVLNEVLSHADACRQRPRTRYQEILVHAIPAVLQYALRHQQDLAILASFAARGEDVASWVSEATKHGGADATDAPVAGVAAAEAHEGEDTDEESDNGDDKVGERPAQQQPQRPAARDTSAASTARHSRADLQTLPRLDALYQTCALKARQATVDRLRSVPRGHDGQVELLVALAEKIGRGEWIQQLGDALFSPAQSQPSTSLLVLLTPLSWQNWQRRAQLAYTAALATVMTSCSGIKAGRNAASPLLAKLAFSETFLDGMWKRSIWNIELLLSQPKTTEDSSAITSVCELLSSFCDSFSHQLLAVNDDDFLRRYHYSEDSSAPDSTGRSIVARDVVRILRVILNDLYWIRPVLASDITNSQNDPDSNLRFQRARVFLSGTKLWNSLYERWCRLYRVVQFCEEDCWWFPHLVSRGQHENNPIIQSQVTSFGGQENDDMDERSVGSAHMDDGMDETATITQHDAGGDALANTFRDPKMARVLTYIPQAMPFSRRVNLFNSLLESDKLRTQDETMSLRQMMMNFEEEAVTEISGRERVTIRRDLLYSDSKHLLMQLGKRLRKRVQVTFVNKHGQQEAGIDGGGVFKEFLDDLIRDAFLPETVRGESAEGDDDDSVVETHPDFFSVTPLQTLTVNTAVDGNDSLSHYEFLGRVLGKAIYGESSCLSCYMTCLFSLLNAISCLNQNRSWWSLSFVFPSSTNSWESKIHLMT